jgi:hypothetical protein
MMSNSEKAILEYKKALFLKEVGKASASLGVSTPKVKFWSHYENHFEDGERAHIHLEDNVVCIAEPELKIMVEEDIIKTATHEVSHLHHKGHGLEFQNTQQDLEIASWEPPPGTTRTLSRSYVPSEDKKVKKSRPVKYKCNFCGKVAETRKCPHCELYFCKEHSKPQVPFIGRVPKDRKDDKNTHLCFPYSRYLDSLNEEKYFD